MYETEVDRGSPDLYYRQEPLGHYDAVLPRIGASVTYYGTAVVRQFQEMDTFCANTAHGIMNSRDKLRSLQILSRHHNGIPRTTFVRDKKDVLPAIKRVGGAPVVVKLIEGTQGIGVLLAETSIGAESLKKSKSMSNTEKLLHAAPRFWSCMWLESICWRVRTALRL
ncbi:MAG: ribosomal protein S6--L-glutamate ligase [Halieaceae bacterium]|jgi:ribosomal protein S6--L-glutamate ligase